MIIRENAVKVDRGREPASITARREFRIQGDAVIEQFDITGIRAETSAREPELSVVVADLLVQVDRRGAPAVSVLAGATTGCELGVEPVSVFVLLKVDVLCVCREATHVGGFRVVVT